LIWINRTPGPEKLEQHASFPVTAPLLQDALCKIENVAVALGIWGFAEYGARTLSQMIVLGSRALSEARVSRRFPFGNTVKRAIWRLRPLPACRCLTAADIGECMADALRTPRRDQRR
jgi:hypothetical protein